jgi:hypothetical protein
MEPQIDSKHDICTIMTRKIGNLLRRKSKSHCGDRSLHLEAVERKLE